MENQVVATEAKLRKRLEALERLSQGRRPYYTARAAVVHDAHGNRLSAIEGRLDALVEEHIPSDLHVFAANHDPEDPDVVVVGNKAEVHHAGRLIRIPMERLDAFWIDEGHKVSSVNAQPIAANTAATGVSEPADDSEG